MTAGIRDSAFGIRRAVRAKALSLAPRPWRSVRRSSESRIPNPESRLGNRRAHGFSLLELIAAILLLAIAFAALMKVAGASMNLSHNAAERSEVAMLARSVLDSAFVGEPVTPGQRTGEVQGGYHWQLDVTPWTGAGKVAPNNPLRLYQLDLEVRWGPIARPRTAHFRTLRLAGGAAP